MTSPLRPTYEPTSNTFFDGTANYVVSGFWTFTGGTSAEFDPTANYNTTGNWTNSGSWIFSNADFTLSGLGTATTSTILYVGSGGLITQGAVPTVTGAWLTAGNALTSSGFLGSTTAQTLNIGTDSASVISIDGTTQALSFPSLASATASNILYYNAGVITQGAVPSVTGAWLLGGNNLSGTTNFGSLNGHTVNFLTNNQTFMSADASGIIIYALSNFLAFEDISVLTGSATPPTLSPPSGYNYLIINTSDGQIQQFAA